VSAGAEHPRTATAAVQPTGGVWVRVPAWQTMHGGQVLPTWGVQVAATGRWVGRAHPIGPSPEEQAEAGVNAALFAASKAMAQVLREAMTAWEEQFEAPDGEQASISGADLLAWFALWRVRVQRALAQAGVR
jgi:hypothetical protein